MDTSKRPSPSQHASQTPIGTQMVGNDGNMWEVVADKNGTHRWVKVDAKNTNYSGKRYYKPSATSSVSRGDLLMTKNGWEFYKKTLTDGSGRVVYTISKLKETPLNKEKWDSIKVEMYLEVGFKWGRYGSFERWGIIASENFVLEKAAEILGKYYSGTSSDASANAESAPMPSTQPQQTSPSEASKEQIEKAIKGLKILADKGNAKAIAAMKGLNYLLSKK